MLEKISGSYAQIAKHIPELKGLLSSSAYKKQLLLKMAREGEKKPHFKEPLGQVLFNYTRKSSNSYDPKFDRDIRKIRPDWFENQTEVAARKKQLLLKMARKGEKKPHFKAPLGQALCTYTRKSHDSYDPKFDRDIRKIRPDWFVSRTEVAARKKKLILKMAKDGKPRPSQKTPLGASLCGYTQRSSQTYDPKFDHDIREIRPDWFFSRIEKTNGIKRLLLETAEGNGPRPPKKTKLGTALGRYTCRTSPAYDSKFDKKVRRLAPRWFVNILEIASRKKKQLILIAERGDDKPSRHTELGRALRHYTTSRYRDPNFDKKIRKLRPDWFDSSAQSNKKILLEMAEKKMPKPGSKDKLSDRLYCYTNPNYNTYDPDFTSKIRKLAPHWLVSHFETAKQNKRKLLAMAKKGMPKPKQTTKLGRALVNYTCKNSESEDQNFARNLKKLAPHWFIPQSQSADQNKKKLIVMAQKGCPKPKTTTPIGASLVRYIYKSSESHDPVFVAKIRKLAPHWFIKSKGR